MLRSHSQVNPPTGPAYLFVHPEWIRWQENDANRPDGGSECFWSRDSKGEVPIDWIEAMKLGYPIVTYVQDESDVVIEEHSESAWVWDDITYKAIADFIQRSGFGCDDRAFADSLGLPEIRWLDVSLSAQLKRLAEWILGHDHFMLTYNGKRELSRFRSRKPRAEAPRTFMPLSSMQQLWQDLRRCKMQFNLSLPKLTF
ncbi:hypothetical protein AAF712_010251 [Marasmius tenuissimus]|uniref:Uncharacterized protein n=1 Tax=Marasmius tenuissimus TaxID=585030 RepID=A0ABR2ZNL8_9AGAR